MSVKVAKFGGSSLANAACFEKVKAIVERDEGIRFVVPSAPGKRSPGDTKITDLLYMTAEAARTDGDYRSIFARVRERYFEIADALSIDVDLARELDNIEKNIRDGASDDYAASRGEYLSGLLLAKYLGFSFLDPAELICFHTADGTYDDDTTQQWTRQLIGMDRVVIPGFYGRRRDGGVKTFSRGGSDITGAIVARAVEAEVYENWTDVSGFMMADPRIVENPKVIRTVSYAELRELSYMGATVLHEDSIFPVRRARIPINVRNTNAFIFPTQATVSQRKFSR